jgi:hypothetical protein
MPTSYLVTTKSAHGVKTSNARYATVDDALWSATAADEKSTGEERDETVTISRTVGSGLICAAMLAIGFGFVIPVSSAVSDLCNFIAAVSGLFFVGLLDGA